MVIEHSHWGQSSVRHYINRLEGKIECSCGMNVVATLFGCWLDILFSYSLLLLVYLSNPAVCFEIFWECITVIIGFLTVCNNTW